MLSRSEHRGAATSHTVDHMEAVVYPVIPGAYHQENSLPARVASAVLPVDAVLTDTVDEAEALATCPRCHLIDATLTNASLAAGGYWRCERCGSNWDQARLATVAGYAAWDAVHQRRARQR